MPQLIASVEGVEIKHVHLTRDRTTLGRKPENDIVLDNMVVSGRHCAFDLVGLRDVFLEDLGSTNGTYIDGKMVKRQQLRDEDVITIGKFRIRFLVASEPKGFEETAAVKLDTFTNSVLPQSMHASFHILTGTSAGIEVPVVKAVSTFGKPGECLVAVSHRRNGYFVAHMDGNVQPLLNGLPVGADPVPMMDQDTLELAGTKMVFVVGG